MKKLLLILTLSVTMLFSVAPAAGQTNIALGKRVFQSEDGYSDFGKASAAVDGNTDGNYGAGSVTHTSESYSPHLQIYLGANYKISEVKIWNRTDCCSERLDNFQVIFFDAKLQKEYLYGPYTSIGNSNPISIPVNVIASQVMVIIRKEKAILSLAEVEVFGVPVDQPMPKPRPTPIPPNPAPTPVPLINLGREGRTISEAISSLAKNQMIFFLSRQSSTYGFGYPDNAVDGRTDGIFNNKSTTHTNEEYQPWWQADLREVQDIREIRVYNRTDCCSERLNNFRIMVSEKEIHNNNEGILYAQGGYDYEKTNTFVFRKSVRAQYVRIYLVGRGFLSLAEVEIMGIDNYKECVQWERGGCVQWEN